MTSFLNQRGRCAMKDGRRPIAIAVGASMLAAITAFGQQTPDRFLVTSAEVVAALESQGLPTTGLDLEIGAPVTAAVRDAQLDLRSGSILNAHEMRLRISCHNHSQCLPFFVNAIWPGAVDVSALPIKMERHAFKHDPVSTAVSVNGRDTVTATERGAATKIESEQLQRSRSIDTPLVRTAPIQPARQVIVSGNAQAAISTGNAITVPSLRTGSSATLQIEEDKIHILLNVICLQDGSIGDTVRVTTRDRKQVYIAEIIAPTLLKGTL